MVGVDIVYPIYYFIGITALITGTSVVLYTAKIIGYVLLVLQLICKFILVIVIINFHGFY